MTLVVEVERCDRFERDLGDKGTRSWWSMLYEKQDWDERGVKIFSFYTLLNDRLIDWELAGAVRVLLLFFFFSCVSS